METRAHRQVWELVKAFAPQVDASQVGKCEITRKIIEFIDMAKTVIVSVGAFIWNLRGNKYVLSKYLFLPPD